MILSTSISALIISLAQGSVIPTRTSRTDPCIAVCEEFSADRRGNGAELCDNSALSQCVYSPAQFQYFCTNLYWAYTDDGQRGLTYSVDGSDLSGEERSSPMTCLDAVHIMGPREVSTASPGEVHYWTPTVPPTTPSYISRDPESLRLHAIAAGWPADWAQPISTRIPTTSTTTTPNPRTTTRTTTTRTPRVGYFTPGTPLYMNTESCTDETWCNSAGAGPEHATRSTETPHLRHFNPGTPEPTTTTTPFYLSTDPAQIRARAIAGGWPEHYFRMYGTTPTPPPRSI